MKIIHYTVLCLLLSGCAISMTCNQQAGDKNSVKSDQEQTPTSKADVKIPLVK